MDREMSQMMIDYTPDNWVIVRIYGLSWPDCKVLAGWSGGYLDGDSWRLSSGITDIADYGDYWLVTNVSGSTYKLKKDSDFVRMNISEPLLEIVKESKGKFVDIEDVYRDIHGPEE